MLNTLKTKGNKFFIDACPDIYEDFRETDRIKLEVELMENIIVFSIDWVDHDISAAGITVEQAEKLVESLNTMIDKIHYQETVKYFRENRKMKLQRNK